MERERWLELSQAISEVACRWNETDPRCTHPTASIVRVYAWAAAHDRSISWACDRRNWEARSRPPALPDQSTLSRRTRRGAHANEFWRFCQAVGKRLSGRVRVGLLQLRRLDGKPLIVAAHSKDRDATWGRGAGGPKCRGYKLHALWSEGAAMPDDWRLAPLNVVEKRMAKRMIPRLSGGGYILADAHFDDSDLHDVSARANHQLLAPRQRPGSGLGHHYQSPHRLRCLAMLEVPEAVNRFGRVLHRQRQQIERDFGNLCGCGGGLSTMLPPWVRRPWRVRNWVHVKLLLNAARIRCVRSRKLAPGA